MSYNRNYLAASRRKRFITRWLVNIIAILLTAKLVRGIGVDNVTVALVAAFILGIVNAYIRPVLVILSLPFTILTLGIFTFVINALMLMLTASIIPGFTIAGFWSAFIGAILISIFSSLITTIFD